MLRVDTHGSFTVELCNAFNVCKLPFNIDSEEMNPLNQAKGREFLSFLRISRNYEDQLAWRTLLEVRHNNIGKTIINLINNLAYMKNLTFTQTLLLLTTDSDLIPRFGERIKNEVEAITDRLSQLTKLIEKLENSDTTINIEQAAVEIVNCIINNELSRSYIVNHICESLKSTITSINELVDSILESISSEEPHLDPNKINILTMHKAKGLSSSVVIIVAAEDEHIPGREISEPGLGDERRLLFVSLTRAKHFLFISYCNKRIGRQRMLGRRSGDPSRHLSQFLTDAPIHPESGIEFLDSISCQS